MQKVVLAIDSFKGCLGSTEAAQAAAAGVYNVFPECQIVQLAVADGGEGIMDALTQETGATQVSLVAHDPLMNLIETKYAISENNRAIIEVAHICGLPLLPFGKRDPLETTTFGVGELIKDALSRNCRDFIIGVGGSATNDAGLGMLQALGYRFFDKERNELGVGGKVMEKVASVDYSSVHPALKESKFTIACDVQNPFCGTDGAAYVFGPQKGADEKSVKLLDKGMVHLSEILKKETGKDICNIPGAGAAGGLGGGFLAMLNAELKSGIKLLLDTLNFSEKIRDADLIITGEGRADRQTIMGKVPFGILEEAKKCNIPVILIAGSVNDFEILNTAGFQAVFSIIFGPTSLTEAMKPDIAKKNITRLVTQISRIFDT